MGRRKRDELTFVAPPLYILLEHSDHGTQSPCSLDTIDLVGDSQDLVVIETIAGSEELSLIHISEPTRLLSISYAVFCLKKKKKKLLEAITQQNVPRLDRSHR
eukprot:TRINITY_DN10047_c0_g1_i3.p1 TRINITY_DN10047_c0_g1~~TRINITY_DN10047_c0_g1_i3.p1  ORF type:complete len:103 (+),score=13.59 TRINITY_DN10047_c0_g1_i3:257-565(+)